jgi:hypothetical protein
VCEGLAYHPGVLVLVVRGQEHSDRVRQPRTTSCDTCVTWHKALNRLVGKNLLDLHVGGRHYFREVAG